MKVKPRPNQVVAIKAALKGLHGRSKRALVVMATGLGKTLTVAFITKQYSAKRVLFLVHNNFILRHAVDEFRKVFNEKTRIACYNGMSKAGAENADIVFATWQTMGRNLGKWDRNHFGLVIVDEAHHTGAETYLPVAKYFSAAKLAITATPDRTDDLDIREVFGPEVVNITLEEAIARGWLPRIEYHVITDKSLDENTLQQIVGEIRQGKKRFTMAEVNRRLFIRKREEEIAQIIDGYRQKAIIFCQSIRHAERMARFLSAAETFHSKKGKGGRDNQDQNLAVLQSLAKGWIRQVCAVNAFNEGVNVPSIGVVVFCRVTESLTIFRQQLGRGLRPGKEKLIVLDFVGNLERIQLVQDMMNKVADLHEQLTSPQARKREGYTRKPFEVSGAGFEFTFSDKVVDLMEVMGQCEQDFYPTWQEASKAAIALGIRSSRSYGVMYKKDPRLHSYPIEKYPDFPGWKKFLDKGYYITWQEASKAAIALGVTDFDSYKILHHKDPMLPPALYFQYPDFPGIDEFLGRETFYPTWQEAAKAAIALGISSSTKYNPTYKKDPRLHGSPFKKYPDFPGWKKFLNTESKVYPSWQEASKAAIALGISTAPSYSPTYKKDPRLPSNPDRRYPDFPGWSTFLGK